MSRFFGPNLTAYIQLDTKASNTIQPTDLLQAPSKYPSFNAVPSAMSHITPPQLIFLTPKNTVLAGCTNKQAGITPTNESEVTSYSFPAALHQQPFLLGFLRTEFHPE